MAARLPRVGCVVMASGLSLRFGENKLLAPFRGRELVCRAFDALPVSGEETGGAPSAEGLPGRIAPEDVVVVTQYAQVAALARARGFAVRHNDAPESGQSRSVVLGTRALMERCGGLVFLAADQPLLRRQTLARLVAAWQAAPERIAALSAAGRRGSPCLFPAALYPKLLALRGDRGGSGLIRTHPERLLAVEAAPEELLDADTAASLRELGALSEGAEGETAP